MKNPFHPLSEIYDTQLIEELVKFQIYFQLLYVYARLKKMLFPMDDFILYRMSFAGWRFFGNGAETQHYIE